MKFITVRDLRNTPAQIWKELPEEQEMIITNNGKPIALLTPISDSDIEETLAAVRKARAVSAVQKMQLSAIQNDISNLPFAKIETEIKAARKAKKK